MMAKEYAVILVEDEDSYAVKKVSSNSFDQIRDMKAEGVDDFEIVDSIVELSTTEDNIVANGLFKEEAIECAEDISEDYVILEL
jgi:hypothetical protein